LMVVDSLFEELSFFTSFTYKPFGGKLIGGGNLEDSINAN
jgi:hypothetical protein